MGFRERLRRDDQPRMGFVERMKRETQQASDEGQRRQAEQDRQRAAEQAAYEAQRQAQRDAHTRAQAAIEQSGIGSVLHEAGFNFSQTGNIAGKDYYGNPMPGRHSYSVTLSSRQDGDTVTTRAMTFTGLDNGLVEVTPTGRSSFTVNASELEQNPDYAERVVERAYDSAQPVTIKRQSPNAGGPHRT